MHRTETEASDVELLAAAPTDVAAFEAFYRRYVRRVTGFAARRCATAEDVADVVAQTFTHLLYAAGRYDPERGEPVSFLFGIAANVVRNHLREEARQRAVVRKAAGCALLDSDDIERIDAAIDAAHRAEGLAAAVDGVPPAEQELLRLVARGRTPGQAAEELGISAGAARTRLSRARTRMRNHLPSTRSTRSEHGH
jgi:RNA polymerase sigma-70 factor, ECF subfamily